METEKWKNSVRWSPEAMLARASVCPSRPGVDVPAQCAARLLLLCAWSSADYPHAVRQHCPRAALE
jgi:hypothetical protein